MIPHIVYRNGAAEVRFPYHRGLVDALKTSIPASERDYDPVTKVWTVRSAFYATIAHRLMVQAFGHVETFNAPRDQTSAPPPNPIRSTDRDFAALHLLPSAPPALVEAAFRCLSKELHPDRGGQHEAMVRLNQAVGSLRARQGVAS